MASLDQEIAKTQEERKKTEQQLASLTSLTFDTDLYGGSDKGSYLTSIPANEDGENIDAMDNEVARKVASYTAPKSLLKEMPGGDDSDAGLGLRKPQKIIDREGEYHQKRLKQVISPERHDPFSAGEKTPDPSVRTYADVMREQALKREKEETLKAIAKKKKEEEEAAKAAPPHAPPAQQQQQQQKRRNRWDQSQDEGGAAKKSKTSDWDMPDTTPGRWDATPTPGRVTDATPGRRNRWDETPTPGRLVDSDATPAGGVTPGATPAGMTWDATPKLSGMATPTPKRQGSRWDETPATMGSATPCPVLPLRLLIPLV